MFCNKPAININQMQHEHQDRNAPITAVENQPITADHRVTCNKSISSFRVFSRDVMAAMLVSLNKGFLLEWILQNTVRHVVTHKQVQADKRHAI